MGDRVVPDRVTTRRHVSHRRLVLLHAQTHREERGLRVIGIEMSEELVGERRYGSVVEREVKDRWALGSSRRTDLGQPKKNQHEK